MFKQQEKTRVLTRAPCHKTTPHNGTQRAQLGLSWGVKLDWFRPCSHGNRPDVWHPESFNHIQKEPNSIICIRLGFQSICRLKLL